LDPTQASFAGDDFVRYTGEVVERAHLQSFAWEAEEKGVDGSHMQANPTQVELMYKKYKQNNFTLNTEEKQSILSKYGGEENLKSIPKELLLAQTENYVEYSADGQVVKGQEAPVMKSKYPEDM
jgi:pre-mRNA-processing factor SLU7